MESNFCFPTYQNTIVYLQSDNSTETYTINTSSQNSASFNFNQDSSLDQSFGDIPPQISPQIYSSEQRRSLNRPQTLNKNLFRSIIQKQHMFKTWACQDLANLSLSLAKEKYQALQASKEKKQSNNNNNEFLQKYKKLEKLGEGSTAQVYKVTKIENGTEFAAKFIKADSEEIKANVQTEYKILQMLKNENIIESKELIYQEEEQNYVIIQELFEGKSLYDYLRDNSLKFHHNFDLNEIKTITKQLLKTIDFIHKNNIIHRDVTVMNVLYDPKSQAIKLIDFGIAREFIQNSDNYLVSPWCNKLFSAPECRNYQDITNKIDIFGIGLILLSLLENKLVLSSKIKKLIQQPQYTDHSKSLHNLAANLVQQDASKRFTIQEAFKYLENL